MVSSLQAITGSKFRTGLIAILFGRGGSWTIYEIAKYGKLPYSSVRRHMQKLLDDGLVERLPNGKFAANARHPEAVTLTRLALEHAPKPHHEPDIDWPELLTNLLAANAVMNFLHGDHDGE